MEVFGVSIPNRALTNLDIIYFKEVLKIPNFRGVFMRDELPKKPHNTECGIVNFNTSDQSGSHWVAYYKDIDRIYFDSYGQVILDEVKNYLKTENEKDKLVIQRNTDIVQDFNTKICGHLCLFVLKALSVGWTFQEVLNYLTKSGAGIKWTNEIANELHKPVRRNFPKRFVFVRNVDDIWGSDLIELQKLSKENSGNRYILTVLDVFSKYGYAVPLKTKTGKEVANALQSIFKKETPKKLWVDRGKEYYNQEVLKLLKENDIEIYSTHNDEKCSVIERWNRTIKTKLWKYFSANGTYKYTDVLQALIDKYNTTKHRSIGMTPTDARKPSNYQEVFKNLYFRKAQSGNIKPKFKVGDKVRISVKKKKFDKGYTINWSDKIYTISAIKESTFLQQPPTYIIQNDKGEKIEGTFYEQELQKSKVDTFRIEKILRWKTFNGKKFARVKWTGYDSSYDSWVSESDFDGDF